MNAAAVPPRADPRGTARAPRLNPFSFPSNTDFFFALLVFAVIAVTFEIYNMFFLWNGATGREYINVTTLCQKQFGLTAENIDAEGFTTLTQGYNACLTGIERKRSLWMLAGALLELALAGVIYLLYPVWITRRGKLSPLTRSDFPQILDNVAELSRAIGLARAPALYWYPFELSASGMAFGRMGQYAVKLTGGLVSQFFSDPEAFNAVLLHELAHIHSRDIDKTYLTVALWNAFLAVTLIPFFFILLGTSTDLILDITWRMLLLVLLVYMIRNVVLRSREYYADLRAYQLPTIRDSLKRMLALLPAPKRRVTGRLMDVHPLPEQRLRMLEDPLPLFELGTLAALATGMVVGIGYEPLMGFLGATVLFDISFLAFLTGFFVAPLVVWIIGLGVWRSTFAGFFDRRIHLNTWQISFGLAVGTFLGRSVSLVKLLPTSFEPVSLVVILSDVVLGIGWTLFLGLSLLFFFRWMALAAASWLPVALEQPSPRLFSTAGMAAAALVLSPWFGAAFLTLYLTEGIALFPLAMPWIVVGFVFLALPSPVTTLVLVILWAFPLAARVWARRMQPVERPGWAYLDASIPVTAVSATPMRFRTALVPALVTGAGFTVLALLFRLGLRVVLSDAARDHDSTKIGLVIGFAVLAAFLQALVAGWVTARTHQYRVFQGMLAAFAAGCLMATGFLIVNLLLGGSINFRFARDIFGYFVNSGGLVAIPLAVLINWLVTPRQAAGGQVYDFLKVTPSPGPHPSRGRGVRF